MHELSIASMLVEELMKYQREHRVRIEAAHVLIGPLSGIDPEALKFAWEPALENFPECGLEKCRLVLRMAKWEHRCSGCGREFAMEKWERICPACGGETLVRTNGNEFLLESIEVQNV